MTLIERLQALTGFQHAILTALSTVPVGMSQRIDGLRCERGVLDTDWWFFRSRLRLMERQGLIERRKIRHSIFPRMNEMPFFAITDKGRATLTAKEAKDAE